MKQKLWEFICDESGQTTTEYVLILAVIVTIFMQFRKRLMTMITKIFTALDANTNDLICKDDSCP